MTRITESRARDIAKDLSEDLTGAYVVAQECDCTCPHDLWCRNCGNFLPDDATDSGRCFSGWAFKREYTEPVE